jgi:hypothetical protein
VAEWGLELMCIAPGKIMVSVDWLWTTTGGMRFDYSDAYWPALPVLSTPFSIRMRYGDQACMILCLLVVLFALSDQSRVIRV